MSNSQNNIWYVDVILPKPLMQYYTYQVPAELIDRAKPGCRTIVQFGKKKYYTGIIRSLHQNKPKGYETKDISDVIDNKPLVEERHLKFWEWISSYYMCSVGDVYKAALPAGMKLESETKVLPAAEFENLDELNEKEELVFQYLNNNEVADIDEIADVIGLKNPIRIIKSLMDKKAITAVEKIKNTYRPKMESFVRLHPNIKSETELNKAFDDLSRAPKQLNILIAFISISGVFGENQREVKKADVLKKADATAAAINALSDKNILELYDKETGRLGLGDFKSNETKLNPLSEIQENAHQEIKQHFSESDVCLLHGVTSSGKTEIYIHLMQEALKEGKQVLYLLPEIALTAQIINRLQTAFGNQVGVYHSKFSDAERVEIFKEINKGALSKYQVILGVRSSLYLPFSNLGLVIIDEEHETTYKQHDPAPRYHARDASIVLAKVFGAKVLLGSATPAVETYFNTKTGKYKLTELFTRHKNIELPKVTIADSGEARRKKKMKSIFTPLLLEEIEKSLANREQIILFQNRRGYSPYMECDLCGWVPKCTHCDVSLTYHKYSDSLVCHYCGHAEKTHTKCPACGNLVLQTKGFGTEKIEDEMALYLPEARIGRMDLDSTRKKHAHEILIGQFENYEIDILIGTQMITKGLDFDRVSLVGILNADNLLSFPDYRAFERAFQLMAQVSGRAGRKHKRGKVVIQTSQPGHPVIKQVIDTDYFSLFKQQISERQIFKYPPFFRHIKITIKHKKPEIINKAAYELAKQLRHTFGTRVLGPETPVINRIQDYYIRNIHIKIEKDKATYKAKAFIIEIAERLKGHKDFKSLQVIYDVDPY